jgi:hypothetical protein
MRQSNVDAPLERIAIDVMGPLPTSTVGNKYLLVIGDYFTKFFHADPMRNQEADIVAKKLIENCITIFGIPMQIHTDQGTNFESNLFKALCKYLEIDKTRTTVMRPQSDGIPRDICEPLKTYCLPLYAHTKKIGTNTSLYL